MIGYHSLDQRKVTPSSLIESVFLFLELVASDTKHGGLANHIPRAVDQGCLSGPSTLIHLQWGNGWWIKKTKNGIQEIKVAALWVNQHFVMFLTSPTQQPKNGIVVIVVVWWMLLRMFLGCLVAWLLVSFIVWSLGCLFVWLLVCLFVVAFDVMVLVHVEKLCHVALNIVYVKITQATDSGGTHHWKERNNKCMQHRICMQHIIVGHS